MLLRRTITLGTLLLVAGCGIVVGVQDLEYGDPGRATETAPTEPAPGPPRNAAPAAPDGAAVDASIPEPVELDAGVDTGVDAGSEPEEDPPVPGALPGCTAADFAANDRRGPNKVREITFPVLGPPAQYSPRCMMIRVGQSVTWKGDLVVDPLAARSQNPASPILPTAAGTTVTFTFVQKGRYRYGSTANPAMRGTVDVRP